MGVVFLDVPHQIDKCTRNSFFLGDCLIIPLSFAAPFGASLHAPLCCTFPFSGHTTTSQFHYGFFFPVQYSGYRIFFNSPSGILFPVTMFFLLYFTHLTFVSLPAPPFVFLHFYTPRQLPHYTFLSCSLETNLCPWFFWVFVLL